MVNHLVSKLRCRSLFATHYHLLVQDWEIDPRVKLGHMDCMVQEVAPSEEEVTFLYKLCDGSSPKSYGINVARLAGMPASLIELALQQSKSFEEKANQKRFSHGQSQGNSSDSDSHASSVMVAMMANRISAVFERLISITNADLTLDELAFIAAEVWKRYSVMREA